MDELYKVRCTHAVKPGSLVRLENGRTLKVRAVTDSGFLTFIEKDFHFPFYRCAWEVELCESTDSGDVLVDTPTTHTPGRRMAGMYAAGYTTSGMVATWDSQRAAVHTARAYAVDMAKRLTRSFSGTVWVIEAVGVGQ